MSSTTCFEPGNDKIKARMVSATNMPPNDYPLSPSLKNLTASDWGKPAETHNEALQSLGTPHVQSFNFMLDEGIRMAIEDLEPIEFVVPEANDMRVSLRVTECVIHSPRVPPDSAIVKDLHVYPSEARQRGTSYKGKCTVKLNYTIDGVQQPEQEKSLGNLPIMLRSDACNLKGMSPKQLVERGEQDSEWGGYFVIGGHERLIRMLQTTRRNYPIAMSRPSWKNRGRNFSDLGILLESGKPDLTTVKNVLHFVTTGTAKYMFSFGKELFFVPVIMVLKCLSNRSDAGIYRELMAGVDPEDHYYRGCVKNILAEPQEEGLFSAEQVKTYIGKSFRDKLEYSVPKWYTDLEVCDYLMRRSVCIHLKDNEDKFQIIVLMIKKLFSLVQDKCVVEGVDSVMMQEIILGGHLYLQLLKEKLERWLISLKLTILKKAKETRNKGFDLTPSTMQWCMTKTMTLERMFENFLGTGNLPSESGLGLMQSKGLTIMAENINRMRYMSHFRAIHRGSFFQEMRTTEVRALLPDAWGFICPVHTPDGSPCGLLNHLAMPVKMVTHVPDASAIPQVLANLGMSPLGDVPDKVLQSCYHVVLNGKVLGFVARSEAKTLADKLRILKIRPDDVRVPEVTEIVLVEHRKIPGQFPGLFLFTGAARMMRPVMNLALNTIEWIGTFEQIFMDISIAPEEAYPGVTTHQELRQTSFLSNLACTIPLPDFNQSPRNMYQCQMGKQTMATPTHTWRQNSETKMYRLQTPTSPFFRPAHYDFIDMDSYPMGTNAIVAVISYTGYDMEDAMIINKSSFERGFAAGTVYKSTFVDLVEIFTGRKNSRNQSCDLIFARDPTKPALAKHLDGDGLPYPGTPLRDGDPLYCYLNMAEGTYMVKKYESKELAFVDSVKLCGNESGNRKNTRVCISVRIPRNPSVGDKFASRAGQKGICSQKWPCEDLPWTESGLFPDIVFNPHGFPSRMTIAMMIECMAGKAGAIEGQVHDATPFKFGEAGVKLGEDHDQDPDDAIEFFAKRLESAGYNYFGTETLYSGTDGVALEADIFFGVIHYQRLRHMVSDKFQVRSTGVIDQVTRQPIKGRRRGGGVRFGEMERDSLLSHGSMFLLQDRLFHGSDKTRVKICTQCGSLLSPRVLLPTSTEGAAANAASRFRDHRAKCVVCDSYDFVQNIELPYIFLHLVCQLASVNIKLRLDTVHR